MEEILREWLYSESAALAVLEEYGLAERGNLTAQAQKFADWMALQQSRAIEKSLSRR